MTPEAIVLGSLTIALAIMIHCHLVTKELRHMAVPQNVQDFIAGMGPTIDAYAKAYAAANAGAAVAAAQAEVTQLEDEATQDNADTLAALQQGLTAATTLPPAPGAGATGTTDPNAGASTGS